MYLLLKNLYSQIYEKLLTTSAYMSQEFTISRITCKSKFIQINNVSIHFLRFMPVAFYKNKFNFSIKTEYNGCQI